MTQRISKAGRKYAQGSHKELGTFPRTCYGCGGKVRITKDTCWQETLEPSGEKRMWHFEHHPSQHREPALSSAGDTQ